MLNYQEMDRAYQALGDRTRRALVERLSHGPTSVSELARDQPMSLPAVMQHLKVLEDSRPGEKPEGRARTCEVVPQMLSEAERWISERRRMWEQNLDRLGALLGEIGTEEKK